MPSGDEIWRSKRGELRIRWPAPGVVEFQCKGHFYVEFADLAGEPIERAQARAPRVFVFVDCEQLTGYESAFRTQATQNVADRAKKTPLRIHYLVRSKLIAMGITLAAGVIGGKPRVFSKREDYEKLLVASVREAKG